MDGRSRKVLVVALIAAVLLLVGAHGALHQDADDCPICSVQAMDVPTPVIVEHPALQFERVMLAEQRLVERAVETGGAPRAPPVLS